MSDKFKIILTHKAIGFVDEFEAESASMAKFAIANVVNGLSDFNMDGLRIEVDRAEKK